MSPLAYIPISSAIRGYILEMIRRSSWCFIQLCTAWWWAHETRNMYVSLYITSIIVNITICVFC